MLCAYECYKIGGPWITFDPSCPVHNGTNDNREESIREILSRVWYREISADDGYNEIECLL